MGTLFRRGESPRGNWVMRYKTSAGRWKTVSSGTPSKEAAAAILRALETKELFAKFGVIDPQAVELAARSSGCIHDELERFLDAKKLAGRGEQYIAQTRRELTQVIEASKWKTPGDIREEGLVAYTRGMLEENLSARTIASVVQAWRGFSRWLKRQRVIANDPLELVQKPDASKAPVKIRRALTVEELRELYASLENRPRENGLTGPERRLLYWTAVSTGLRANELRQLRVRDLSLSGDSPRVVLAASKTKSGKQAVQFLSKALAAALRAHIKGREESERVFPFNDRSRLARVLRSDLAFAREKWVEAGETEAEKKKRAKSPFLRSDTKEGATDFHSLRHTTAAMLARTGASAKLMQSMMRHSDANLTLGLYGALLPSEASQAAELLDLTAGAQQMRSKLDAKKGVSAARADEKKQARESASKKQKTR